MGVPKFFRYISERYPCLSELVKEYQIPEFDNLYLDMNGIIHMCSHPDDGNPHFRITEEKIFRDIFHYIEVLFRMIRPQKLFFMAIDGVAPRAKMNQQRGRRFRSAKDAEKQEDDAIKKGEKLPQEARFDSNCITPGTVFMARLHKQLQYFVVDKISNDRTWQKCKVILSGHETPGEGEHKIMDYIRYMRAQPNYDPNTRHCLYGLDADLIMLGLCTHEPHFSLLREEVKFGKKSSSKRTAVPEETTFFLLHLSLMREYLELEFAVLKDKLKGFTYDFEKIIDDWVLMGFLVGNDFIPHLPNLHIANGALPILYKAYMDVLPELDGYINESGNLNLARFEKFMGKLSSIDLENFEEIRDDLLYMESKTGRKANAHYKVSTKNLEEWIPDDATGDVSMESLEPTKQPPRDSCLAALIKETDDMCIESENDEEFSLSEEDEAFGNFKKEYYLNKLEYAKVTPEVMRDQAEGYVRAIQWNLNYYYNGCCSWSWYYPHHYAPYISDIKGFADLKIEFDSGKPFLPYEQLLAVLPTASKDLLPSAYHDLMTEDNSLIKKYYPVDFQTDLNGKRQEWEAVVLVPFIDEKLLLEAMSYCNDQLTEEEKDRNSHGPMLIYTFTPRSKGVYQAPNYFPQVDNNHTEIARMNYNDVLVPQERLVKGAYPGVKMGVYYPGFPTMKHLQYKGKLKKAKIKVFEQPSRSDNMIITIIPDTKKSNDKVPVDLLGTTIFVGWPHLVEAKVVAISNANRKYVSAGEPGDYNVEEMGSSSVSLFKQEVEAAVEFFQHRWGIEVGATKVLVHVRKMIGRRYSVTPNGRVTLEKEFAPITSRYPLQTIVYNISSYDSCQAVFRDIEHVFPKGSVCFLLTNPYYGCQGVIEDSRQCKETGRVRISITATEEPNLSLIRQLNNDVLRNFKNLHTASGLIGCSPSLYTRLTGSLFLTRRNYEGGLKNVNIGLDLKFNKKNKETPGYTKKIGNVWYYSDATSQLVKEYCKRFPKVVKYVMRDHNYEEIAIEEIYGDNWEEKLKEMQNWLKSLPSYSIERQICGSSALTPEVIKALEDLVGAQGNVIGKKVVMQVKPGLLYRPEIQNGSLVPDPSTDTYILDRIINVREGFSVPLGLKGTVVAIREPTTGIDRDRMFDILFDKPFKDGLALDCSEGRGYRLPPTAFINISFGVRMKELKSGKTDEVITKVEPAYHPSYQAKPEQKVPQVVTPMNKQWYPGQPLIQQPRYPIAHQNSAFAQFSVRPPPYNMPQDPRATQYFVPPNGFDVRPQPVNYSYQMPVVPPMYQPQPTGYTVQSKAKQNLPMPALPTFNNFMPNFASGGSQEQAPQNPVHLDVQLVTSIKTDKTPETETTETAKTDFLKSLLKVGEVKDAEKPAKKEMPPPIVEKKQVDDEKPSSVDFNQLVQVSNIPASIRLLTFYQSNGLGMPRYQYFNTGNQVQAQITVGKETINGSPASSREEASENVAKDVLELLMSKANNGPQINDNFPPPPKTWVQPEATGKSKQKNTEARYNLRSCGKAKIEATTILNNSFVPLQAVKSHIKASNSADSSKDAEEVKENIETLTRDNAGKKASKLLTNSFVPLQAVKNHIKVTKSTDSSKDAEEIKENIETLTCDNDGEKAEKASKGHMTPEGNTGSKPKKGRKTRIAANFLKKD